MFRWWEVAVLLSLWRFWAHHRVRSLFLRVLVVALQLLVQSLVTDLIGKDFVSFRLCILAAKRFLSREQIHHLQSVNDASKAARHGPFCEGDVDFLAKKKPTGFFVVARPCVDSITLHSVSICPSETRTVKCNTHFDSYTQTDVVMLENTLDD